jgi:hypothetical protein
MMTQEMKESSRSTPRQRIKVKGHHQHYVVGQKVKPNDVSSGNVVGRKNFSSLSIMSREENLKD